MGIIQTRLPTEEDIEGAKLYSRELARYADKDRVHVIQKHSSKQGQMR